MGIMECSENGTPIQLVFDCVQKGTHEINTTDGKTLRSVLKILSKRINTPYSEIANVLYNYNILDQKRTIQELNLPNGAVILIKFKPYN